jgi:glycosyltransferase involved in cell wall biosynthesis
MSERILVFIPVYQCEAQITRVLNQFDSIIQKRFDTVLVVDNQSGDDTLDTAIVHGKAIFSECNFIVIRNDSNLGLGGSHKAAFKYAIENGFDFLVVLHGDDQANINDLLPQLDARNHLSFDCLLGARFMRNSKLDGYSRVRLFGNHIYNRLFSLITGDYIHDLGSGLNLYRLESFREFYFEKFPDDLTFNYVMLLASYFRMHRLSFFPISWREDDQVSNVRIFRQAIGVLALLAKFALKRGGFLSVEMRERIPEGYTGKIIYQYKKH